MPNTLERFYGYRGNDDVPLLLLREAASQTFKAGDLVTLTSNKVAVAGSDNSDLTSAGAKILGMALKDASGVTDTIVPVVPATDETWFLLGCYNATKASAIPNNINVGEATTLRRQGGVHAVNVPAAGSNQNAIIVGRLPQMDSEPYGPVWVKITAASRVLG